MERVSDIYRKADDRTLAQLLYRLSEYGKGCPYPTDPLRNGKCCKKYEDCEDCFYDWLTHPDPDFIVFSE